ncbi:lytic polysaccharide monooxygenase [Fulvivirga ulvae]|uniref:lytic polysaccharide monooxygenase n=1 Tax=Fulvivirga ulvae TaxID=2904245 RepID=UPI001F3DC35F|nr:lytic polysaccharide monooxygenase [Fulvivirga ulvae]UII31944.1 lytic polysaccharide monooxygenase [Fulvivirga ulvae]
MKKTLKILVFLCLLGTSQYVYSHGTVIYPPSRIYNCYTNSSPVCEPCGDAVYNWMGVLQPHTNYGNHPAYVPDGQIASGGNGGPADFSCLDALTTDWPATTVNYGYIDVKWKNTAPHLTQYYKVYITQLNWDPTKPLRWNDLIEIGHVGKRPAEPFTTIRSYIPDSYAGKRAALVSVWQRDYTHSHEAFYSVSDIFVSGDVGCNTGDPIDVTFANNTDCTLQYYQNNDLKGSANAGGSYPTNTTVGSEWQARKTSGDLIDSFITACNQTTYSSSGQCDDNGCSDGDAVNVTFTNNTDCALEYYQNNDLKGSANAGGSYATSATVGSQWQARKTSGDELSSFTIVCDQATYNSTGSCNDGTGGCAPAYGPYPNYYMNGDIVSYSGHNYESLSDNLFNVTPGTAAHWWKDLGPCTANINSRVLNQEELSGELNFVAFPNPANDIINLQVFNPQSSSYTITIMTMDGRVLETMKLQVSEGSARVNQSIKLNKLSPGIYFVNVTSGKKTTTKKIIVE